MAEKKEPRINNGTAILMIMVALICDLLGPFGAVGAVVVFFIWFRLKKVSVIGTKQAAKHLVNIGLNAIGEALTAGFWAGATVGVFITIWLSRIEDRFGVQGITQLLTKPPRPSTTPALAGVPSSPTMPGGAPLASRKSGEVGETLDLRRKNQIKMSGAPEPLATAATTPKLPESPSAVNERRVAELRKKWDWEENTAEGRAAKAKEELEHRQSVQKMLGYTDKETGEAFADIEARKLRKSAGLGDKQTAEERERARARMRGMDARAEQDRKERAAKERYNTTEDKKPPQGTDLPAAA